MGRNLFADPPPAASRGPFLPPETGMPARAIGNVPQPSAGVATDISQAERMPNDPRRAGPALPHPRQR